jgi:alpha-glucosidase
MRGCLGPIVALIVFPGLALGQGLDDAQAPVISITSPTNIAWWAGIIEDGFKMPLADGYQINVWADNHQNQVQPLLLSDQGDIVWSDGPFRIQFQGGANAQVDPQNSTIYRNKAGNSLRDAFLYASRKYFPPSGKTPDDLLFSSPQYNTWIELMYDQSQAGILKYAQGIVDNGFPAGVLMIDDNWQEDY